jgi:hypothetical protein
MKAFVFSRDFGPQAQQVLAASESAGFQAVLIASESDASGETFHLESMEPLLAGVGDDDALLLVDGDRMEAVGSLAPLGEALDSVSCALLFAADFRFHFPDERLRRFYWKFHPRHEWPLPFANPSSLIGTGAAVRAMIAEGRTYGDGGRIPDQTIVSRFHADQLIGLARSKVVVALDGAQRFFSLDDVGHARFLPNFRAIYRFEQSRLMGNAPHPGSRLKSPLRAVKTRNAHVTQRMTAGINALGRTVKVAAVNRGELRPSRLFRYLHNRNPEWDDAIRGFLAKLENGFSFAFVHFNDGEMTFLRQFCSGDHRENWFGRKQNKYNPDLGRRLLEGIQHRQENYFVGIPCSTCHPSLRALADQLRPGDAMTIPAMTLHHNLSHMPRLFAAMRGRRIFWFKNELQDLSVLRALGLSIAEEDVTNVPFREAHRLYDEMSSMRFADGAVVIMTCGMLAKIIIPHWFQKNPDVTFLTLGSAFDDLIQQGDPNYRRYPADLPWTGDVHRRKSFLFGRKKSPCKECFDVG